MIHCILLNPTIDRIFHVPELQTGYTYNLKDTFEFPVGKAISVALTMREFISEIFVVAIIGKPDILLYEEFLTKHKIAHRLIPIDGKTRQNITIIEEKSMMPTHFRMPGFEITNQELYEIENYIVHSVKSRDYIVFSGSCPKGTPKDYFNHIAPIINSKNANLIVDTSGPFLSSIFTSKPLFIKGNLEEMGEILNQKLIDGQELDQPPTKNQLNHFVNLIQKAIQKDIGYCILTLGKYGAILITDTKVYYSKILLSSAPYSVGSGDAFLGGFLVSLHQNKSLKDAFIFATACGAANTQTMGAGILESKIVAEYVKKVEFEEI
jgi:1-phosphofructokinase family hexose kinase